MELAVGVEVKSSEKYEQVFNKKFVGKVISLDNDKLVTIEKDNGFIFQLHRDWLEISQTQEQAS